MKALTILLAMILAAPSALAQGEAAPTLDELKWVARPIVVFADSPNDPRFIQQIAAFEAEPEELAERDVVVLTDTDPDARGPLRQRFRPRDFGVLVLDKEGTVAYRKPDPVTVREVIRLIDRMPLRLQEMGASR